MPRLKHNHSTPISISAEYRAWIEMRRRAGDRGQRGNVAYIGIAVCSEWETSFEAFYRDVGPRPSTKHSLDRYPDPHGNYEPNNVRWATVIEQNRNRVNNRYLTVYGERKLLIDWAKERGLSVPMVWRRLKAGWPPERLLDPPMKYGQTLIRNTKAMPTTTGA